MPLTSHERSRIPHMPYDGKQLLLILKRYGDSPQLLDQTTAERFALAAHNLVQVGLIELVRDSQGRDALQLTAAGQEAAAILTQATN